MLKPSKGWKPPVLEPKVRVESVHLQPAGDESNLLCLVNGAGLRPRDSAGFQAHGIVPDTMWLGDWSANMSLEFELPEPVALSNVEIWNYNDEWQTTNGIQKLDISVSIDGTTWNTVLRGAELREAFGTPDKDMHAILKLNGTMARKVRFENLVPIGTAGKVGLSEVIFHEAVTNKAGILKPADGTIGVRSLKQKLEWTPAEGATEHRVYLGATPGDLALVETTQKTSIEASVNPASTNFWRVDEVLGNGSVATGRVVRFDTVGTGPLAWWKLDQTEGSIAKSTSGLVAGSIKGQPHWVTGAFEFDGNANFVDCGNTSALEVSDGMALAVWIKVRKFDKTWQAIATKGEHAWRVQRNQDTGTLEFTCDGLRISDNGFPGVFSTRTVDDGQWHHIVALYDGERMALYLDGQLEQAKSASGSINQNPDLVLIGENSGAPKRFFNGWMKDVRLFGRGLSEKEVQAIYQEGAPSGQIK